MVNIRNCFSSLFEYLFLNLLLHNFYLFFFSFLIIVVIVVVLLNNYDAYGFNSFSCDNSTVEYFGFLFFVISEPAAVSE